MNPNSPSGSLEAGDVRGGESGWMPIETAPRDGSEFLARCIRRSAFSLAPTYFPDIAKWSGTTPDDHLGHFASRRGDIVTHWSRIPPISKHPTSPRPSTPDRKV